MKILATDLDRTLLPNGDWPADSQAIPLFNELTERHGLLVVYVTGRSLALTEQAIEDFAIRYPHVLIGDVGSSIRRYQAGQWQEEQGWLKHVARSSPAWQVADIQAQLLDISGLRPQPAKQCGPFKQSYFVDHSRQQQVMTEVAQRLQPGFDHTLIYSYDSLSGDGLLDVMPKSATKRTALEYLAQQQGLAPSQLVFCGDSGNDIEPLSAGFKGVVVRNGDEQLRSQLQLLQHQQPGLQLYFARGGWQGFNGYYASGVLEGASHYGLFGGP